MNIYALYTTTTTTRTHTLLYYNTHTHIHTHTHTTATKRRIMIQILLSSTSPRLRVQLLGTHSLRGRFVIKEDMFLRLFLLVTTTIAVVVPVESYHVECDPTCHEDIEFASISILNGTTMMKYQAQPVRKIRTHTLTTHTHTHTHNRWGLEQQVKV
jgi:hypothetical protein